MVWEHAAFTLRQLPVVGPIVIAIDPEDRSIWEGPCALALRELDIRIVIGGAERVASVRSAFASLPRIPLVAIHDAARPLVKANDLMRVFESAAELGAALLACPVRGTIKQRYPITAGQCDSNSSPASHRVRQTVDRNDLWEALTPQVFHYEILHHAFERWQGFPVTDDAQLVERAGYPVTLVEGSPTNIKITVADDLKVANALLQELTP
jgi:2-C-methyl-D-erythritol 4-phosphate cytidylyltransferase